MTIKNFIELTKIFTRSPFDTILLKQNEVRFFYYKNMDDKNMDVQRRFMELTKEKKEIFSFEKMKPNLVFFNMD